MYHDTDASDVSHITSEFTTLRFMAIPIPILQGLRLFDQLPQDELAQLSPVLHERRVERREIVVKRGDTQSGLGFLLEGRLQSVSFTLDGKEVGTDFISEGDFFGELTVIDGRPAPEFVIAVAPSRVTSLGAEQARKLMFANPESSIAVALRLAERLRRAADHRALLALPSSFQRVCAQLLFLARHDAAGTRFMIRMPPTHQEIAIMINTSRETVTRTLQFLLAERIVSRDGPDLLVASPETLRAAVDGKVVPNPK